jgi:drug/metabolite transporter (DMT)-like permease
MSQMDSAVSAAAPSGPDVAALVAGLFTVTLWGSAFVGIRAAGAAFSPGSLALAGLLVSCAVLGLVALVRRDPLPRVRDLGQIALYGIAFPTAIDFATWGFALRRTNAGSLEPLRTLRRWSPSC